jgi:hypothetical protein
MFKNKKAVALSKEFKRSFFSHRLVDFIVCGTQKGGTSALYAYLDEHPQICMASKKEVHFFDDEKAFSRNKPNYGNYHTWFSPEETSLVLGEATPIYMYWYSAPKRIWAYNPNIKLVVMLRNPIERAYSHWNMERSKGNETLDFREAIMHERSRCREALPEQHRIYSYVDRGFYLEQLCRLWTYFPRDNVLVLKNEDLKSAPDETLKCVCDFIGVSHFHDVTEKDVHSRPYTSKMDREERSYLQGVFEYEIKALERELNWDCSDWL